jgi:hypothetical protein
MRRRIVIGLAMLVAILGVVGAFAVPSVTVDPCRVQDGVLPGCTLLPLTQTNNWTIVSRRADEKAVITAESQCRGMARPPHCRH